MIIFPAIDIKGGKCVRLLKGDFNQITQYKKSPIDQANEFLNFGFNNIHLIFKVNYKSKTSLKIAVNDLIFTRKTLKKNNKLIRFFQR